ncbi:MAG TPA: VWA domain-containing protein [Vicinamibacterales bacterium]
MWLRYRLPSLIALVCAALFTMQHPSAQQAAAPQPAASQPAQTPQAGVTFRAEANFVEVHAIVTDRDDAFVRDLTADDFEIYEDGRLVKPTVFQLVDLPVERPFTPANASAPVEPDVRATTRNFDGRIYILLLDDLHTTISRTPLVKDAAKRFVEEYLGTNDLAAVVHVSGRQDAGQELTNSRRLLLAAIDRFIGRKIPSANVERLAVHLRDQVGQDSNDQQSIRTPEGAQRARDIRDPLDPERGTDARRALEAIENVSTWLSDVQGRRKALLFFSEGIDYDIYDPFNRSFASGLVQDTQEAIAAAQRANVNVYGVDPRGLNQFGGDLVEINARSDYPQLEYGNFRGALRELLLSQESLIGMSEETGGLAIVNRNDLVGGLGRIVLDNSRYYLLGYYSDESRWRGRFMKIEVRMKRPGLQVRARRGYLPPNNRAAQRAREAEVKAGTTPALRAALSKPVPVGDLPFRAFAAPFKAMGANAANASVLVALEIDGSSLKFQERNGRFAETLEISIVAADQRARVQGGDRQTFDLNLMPQTHERVSRTGVRVLSRVDVPPGRYQIRVGVHESTGGTVATVPLDVEVPDYSKMPFAMSGVLLSVSPDAGVAVTANAEVQPQNALPAPAMVRRTFTRAETLTAYAEVYDNSSPMAHGLNFAVRVINAADGRSVLETRDRRDVDAGKTARMHGFSIPLPLRDLQPGMYVLRAEAEAGNQTALREVPFEVK